MWNFVSSPFWKGAELFRSGNASFTLLVQFTTTEWNKFQVCKRLLRQRLTHHVIVQPIQSFLDTGGKFVHSKESSQSMGTRLLECCMSMDAQ